MTDARAIQPGYSEEPTVEPAENSAATNSIDSAEAEKFLSDFGFLPIPMAAHMNPDEINTNLTEAIVKFQEFFHLPQSGSLDNRTVSLMRSSRCGLPDIVSYSLAWSRWYDHNLTYRIVEYHDSMSIDHRDIRQTIREAMQMWMEVTPLILCEEDDPDVDVDINIRHVRGEHGDGIAFDGPGGTLGHAFLPTWGEVHFDSDENWSMRTDEGGINYLNVAVHEIGHVLGLLHSGEEDAIMFPFYTYRPVVRLANDDINGIQLMYGTPDIRGDGEARYRCPKVDTDRSNSTSQEPVTTDVTRPIMG
ncbi:matrilysin-like [Diadema antillarum]|uniref:matrilysin-like n=1 Tax=Diadema antillarum TaxID=105358 RepID=UPI003A8AAD6B